MHHAHLLVGERKPAFARACEFFGISETERHGDPDVQTFEYAVFGIDEARLLQNWASQSPISRPRRLFIIACESMTHETQNALLKLFEDPPSRASVFMLIVPKEDAVIPTLRSRFNIIQVRSESTSHDPGRSFIELAYKDRLAEIALRQKVKDTAWNRTLLSSLEHIFYAQGRHDILAVIAQTASAIERRGASPKMLLEHLALSVPKR